MREAPGLRGLSLRVRMVALAALLVTVVLLVAGVLLGLGLRSVLLEQLRVTAQLRAEELADLAARGALPQPVPVDDPDEALVQVVSGGVVTASSANIEGLPRLEVVLPAVGDSVVVSVGRLPVEEQDGPAFIVAATTVRAASQPTTVIVGISSEEVGETLGDAAGLGLRALPILVAALSIAVWVVVTRTLAPVEGIRARAEAITGSQLHQRVPEPRHRDEVGRLARTLNAMLGRVERSVERQQLFVADAAHELRSPITSARIQLETARASQRPVDWESVSAGVLAETLRMQQLTDQLLVLARVDAGELRLRRELVDLDDLVDVATAPWRESPAGCTVDILGVQPVQLVGDRTLLERVVRNLLDNAHRHARARVAVTLVLRDGAALLTVDDDGPGIPVEAREAVFERFHRVDDSRDRDEGGAGLGLAIVADIVRAHQGHVRAEASPLGGARLTVSLPIPVDESLSALSQRRSGMLFATGGSGRRHRR